jgi:hypothetical protein
LPGAKESERGRVCERERLAWSERESARERVCARQGERETDARLKRARESKRE